MGSYSLSELAAVCGGRIVGDPNVRVDGIGTLQEAGEGQLAFLMNRKYRKQLETSRASVVILTEADLPGCPTNALVAANPYLAYARLTQLFANGETSPAGIHPTAVVDVGAKVHDTATIGAYVVVGAGAVLGPGVHIGAGCSIGADVRIGADSRLYPNVTIYHGCLVGERATIHSGTVIGSDGFGFANDHGNWVKVHQLGVVRIGDDVEIGANTSIDRGAINDTIIEDGVKLDNQIQVAHNVRIGAHTAIAGCVGIAGSASIGRHCAIGGGVGILGHLEIADGVTVTAMSLVTKSIRTAGVYSSGTPLEPSDEWQKNFVRFKQLDEMARRLRQLEHEIEELKKGTTP